MRTKVTKEDIQAKIAGVEYFIMPDGRTTIAHVTLRNGFTVRGESACVNAVNFNKELGEQYAMEKAIDKIWELEGYLLAEQLSAQEESSNLVRHAMMEFKAAGWVDEDGKFCDELQKLMCDQVVELLKLFSSHGHSGSSAPYAIGLFEKLAKFEPIVPLTGEDCEWNEVGDGTFQNKRCSHVFKQADRFDGQAYDIEAVIFWEWHTDSETGEKYKTHFTSAESCQPIQFPYTPTREYRERITEGE